MEPVKTSIWKIAITSLLTVMAISDIHAQQGEKKVIFNKWHLDGYVVEGKKHAPSNKEREDYILFREDMTFASKSEGQDEKGTYILNTNGAYVLLIDENGEKIKAYIISISKQSLILKYDFDEIRDIEVHYNRPI
ncbi:MAG: hypothetical protein ACI9K1_001463 [Arcticibacterium sp.]|jgi:hypothetical protein